MLAWVYSKSWRDLLEVYPEAAKGVRSQRRFGAALPNFFLDAVLLSHRPSKQKLLEYRQQLLLLHRDVVVNYLTACVEVNIKKR